MCILAAGVCTVAVFMVDPSPPSEQEIVLVENDPSEIQLPDLGLFGGQVVVYGASGGSGVAPQDLECRLLTSTGREQNSAKMSYLFLITQPPVSVEGTRLYPLFAVSSYPSGSVLKCDRAASVAPLAVSQPSTFGGLAGLVRVTAAVGAVISFMVGVVGWFLFRPEDAQA